MHVEEFTNRYIFEDVYFQEVVFIRLYKESFLKNGQDFFGTEYVLL